MTYEEAIELLARTAFLKLSVVARKLRISETTLINAVSKRKDSRGYLIHVPKKKRDALIKWCEENLNVKSLE